MIKNSKFLIIIITINRYTVVYSFIYTHFYYFLIGTYNFFYFEERSDHLNSNKFCFYNKLAFLLLSEIVVYLNE